MARLILSFGILAVLAVDMACRRRGFASESPPPSRAAIINSFISFVNILPRFESVAAFLRLIVAHLLCPDIISYVILIIKTQNYDSASLIPNEGISRNVI